MKALATWYGMLPIFAWTQNDENGRKAGTETTAVFRSREI